MKALFVVFTLFSMVACSGGSNSSKTAETTPPPKSDEKATEWSQSRLVGKWGGVCVPSSSFSSSQRQINIGDVGYEVIWMGVQQFSDSSCTEETGGMLDRFKYEMSAEDKVIHYWPAHRTYDKSQLNVEIVESNHIRVNGTDYYRLRSYFP